MRTTLLALLLLASATTAGAQQFFQNTDGTVAFSKAAFADVSDPANWDVISDNVALARGSSRGIFNPFQEASAQFLGGTSPLGTRWFFGGTVQDVIDGTITLGQFDLWFLAFGGNQNGGPPSTVGVPAVLYLEDDDAFVDIMFTSWGEQPASGASFSYTRAVVNLVPEPTTATLAAALALGLFARRRR